MFDQSFLGNAGEVTKRQMHWLGMAGKNDQKKLIAVNNSNLKEFKHLHNCIFINNPFPRVFYTEAVEKKKPGIHYIAVCDDKNVGVLSAIVEQESNSELYIYSLGCKYLYRRKGIGSYLLDNCIEFASNQNCKQIKLHVKEDNDDALSFYKKHGFYEFELVIDYYKRPERANALILYKEL